MICNMDHELYKVENTKITFKQHSKLCWSNLNYTKFHVISNIVQFIWDYSSVVNYDIAHSKIAHKYFLKLFYNKTNKKSITC